MVMEVSQEDGAGAQDLYRGCSTGRGQVSTSRGWIHETLFAVQLLPPAGSKWLSQQDRSGHPYPSRDNKKEMRHQDSTSNPDVYLQVIKISGTLKKSTEKIKIGQGQHHDQERIVAFDHPSSLVSLTFFFLQSSSVYAPLYTRYSAASSPWSWNLQWHPDSKEKKNYLCCTNEYFQHSRNNSDGNDMQH